MFTRQDLKAAALACGAFLLALAGAAPAGAAYQCPGTTTPLTDAVCQDPNTARTSIAQAPGSGNPIDLADERIVVPLDNTGIQSWSFLNPRNPFPLVRPAQPAEASALASSRACIREALRCTRIEFHNQTLDREFDVTFKFTLTVPEIGNIGLLAKVADLERRVRGQAGGYLRDLAAAMADSPETGSEREQELTAMSGSCRSALEGLTTPEGLKEVAKVLEGAPDRQEYLGPCTRFAESLQQNPIAELTEEVDEFATEIRKLDILLRLPNPENICKHRRDPRILDCSFRHGVPANTPNVLPLGIIGLLPVNDTVEFTVSLQQEEDAVLTNKTGYLATGPTGREPDNRTSWTASTAVGYDYKPTKRVVKVDGVETILPYDGERTSTSSATGRLGFAAFLGDRARGEVSLAYKKGVLGDGTDGTAKAELYTFSIFAKSGLTLRMGKYEIAAPASGIAISETGEGGELIKPGRRGSSYSLGYLARRESADDKGNADPKGNDADLDSDLYIFQAKGLSFGNGFFRSGNVVALWGEDENDASKIDTDKRPLFLKQPHKYWTAGGELQFAIPDSSFSGSLAHFWSHLDREGRPENPEPDGDGMATLLTFGWAQVDDAKERTLRKFTIVAGMGSGDDPKTKENDGYLGENASGFTGNTILLTHLAGNIPNVEKGMVNKTFAGFEITDNDRLARILSPLRGIVNILNTQDQIIDESLVFRIYGFRFNEPLLGKREASLEATTEFSIQVPSGVRTTLKVGYLLPGPALKTLVGKDPWFVSTQVKLDIK